MTEYLSSEPPAYITAIRTEVMGRKPQYAKRKKPAKNLPPDPEDCRYLFTVCTGNRWMELGRREPESKMLFGELWHQHELCILFAATNVGKSILAVQIANSIARGEAIAPFALDAPPARVLYIDFELSTSQFWKRYAHNEANYNFNDRFYRAEFNAGTAYTGNNSKDDDHLIAGIEYKIKLVKATVLIIDNVSCLRGGTENAAVALRLIKNLKSLKTDYNLSILVLAHTPKRRNTGLPISADDLHGSKLLINLADSAFAIGTSGTDPNLRYLKQIKQRSSAQIYGEDNVCLCRITKPSDFLQMQYEGNSHERLHLRSQKLLDRDLLAAKVAELAAKGYRQRQISNELGVSLGLVNKLMPGKVDGALLP